MGSLLKFKGDGTFKIAQFTDIHLKDGFEPEKDERTLIRIGKIIEEERPDLIALTGDVISSEDLTDQEGTFRRAIDAVAGRGIPFAVIYGNHDSEKGVTRRRLNEILREYPDSLTEDGPEDVHGVGNYVLGVAGSSGGGRAANLYFFDSGEYAPEAIGGYAWMHPDQVQWYRERSTELAKASDRPLPSLAFFHIPIPEYDQVLREGKISGYKGETVCCPKLNSGLFSAMLEQGDVIGTFAGHDHDNDYVGDLYGIRLCYGRVTGNNTYGVLKRGARMIEMREGERTFGTWIVEAE